ncbi:metal ABC transporter ATP-binding protein (plasmid) [Haloferax mediterranei ATCC 33500]|uniref:Cobalamin import ATP-binding protein BtuD n=1 Tax=Haloferax mediterranei (strain ATCC 33500 / DSM 1411 / JCM 8866 / NBRC 14739 / NCIMB 2177 / R-4) TaxID=523841 RepID=I3RAZ7_HALMT|nr:metal ABC transporter ATP-binding protein [Haloferax mediterranei]AFK21407.1 ABC-type transport system ATP-binding protein [Haloferax mediterranei ATCC 33500]AHZ24521.1 ABC transporter ATP-binding protein [Haloferax mediterranei ATCC 33500]ELZ97273.1 ABC-type transport system ATP-binding protein [Haloferax mediterranei ATCC 33500]MDX5990425.1 metal ABC transporter ATP-binding protein [Haloferax mediterranei ATCC 33500]QCQ76917.1 metal ABC transporter ATP-binding protein [Haloferax mediterra
MTVISLDDVAFSYGDVPVIDGISLDVEQGEFLGLVGPNGSGKSTLLTLLLGLQRPDRGEVRLFGEPAHQFADGERIAYVAQDVTKTARDMPITVREVVRMGRYPRNLFGRFSDADHEAVETALDRVDIVDLADRRVGSLSGGQRQRVFVARALAAETDLLALDEPTVALDAESRESFYDLLRDLNEQGMTIVLVEHDISVVTARASRIACLNKRLYFHGSPDDFAESDALAAAYGANQRVLDHDHCPLNADTGHTHGTGGPSRTDEPAADSEVQP